MTNVTTLPVWKVGGTPEEKFLELARYAKDHPEKFARIVVVFESDVGNNRTINGHYRIDVDTTYAIGMLEVAKMDVYQDGLKV
jgi:hypothetical protein